MTTPPVALTEDAAALVQQRTVRTLVLTQVLSGLGISTGVAVAALLARELSGSETQAGFAQTASVLGAAVAAVLLARLMARRDRRIGIAVGLLAGTVGAVLCVVAGAVHAFPVQLVGAVLLGSATAAGQQSRYAATDLAQPQHRARALSLVVWSTTVGSVVGPNLVGPGASLGRALGIPELAGPFVIAALAMLLSAVVVLVRLRPDPLLTAMSLRHNEIDGPAVSSASPWSVLRTVPALRAAVVAMACAHSVMVAVMVMTPIHMEHGDASIELVGLTISVHILGMYALSPLVGRAVDRFGPPAVMAAAAVVLLVALALAGTSVAGASVPLGAGLFLLGVGWSLAMVSTSTLVTSQAPAHVRAEVQGLSDTATFVAAAVAGAAAGVVLAQFGFAWLNAGGAVLALVVGAAALAARRAGATDQG